MNRLYLPAFVTLFVLLSSSMIAQSDSLLRIYHSEAGIKKIETGLKICSSLEDYPEEYLIFSKQLLSISEKQSKKTMLHARVLRAVSDAFYFSDSIDESNKYLLNTIRIASAILPADNDFIGEAYNDLGLNYMDYGKRTEAYDCLLKANQYLKNSRNLIGKADGLSNLAVFYHSGGQFEKATDLFIQAYELDKKTGNKQRQSSSLNSIGRVYVDWGKYNTGLQYYLKSLEILDTIKDKSMTAIRYNNIGMVYQLKKDHKNAIKWIDKARKIEAAEGNTPKLAIRYFNLASSYAALKDHQSALKYYTDSEKIFSSLGQDKELSKVYAGLGQLMMNRGDNKMALIYLEKSLEKAEKAGTLPEKSNIYRLLYEFYKKNGQFEKALQFFDQYISSKDSIFNLNSAKQVEELEVQYQTAQKELEINRLESENDVKQKEVNFRKRERNIATIGFLILAALLGILYKLFRTVKQQKTILSSQNKELDRLNQIQNQLFSIISHDFRSITSSYQASAKIIENFLKKGQPEKLLPIADEITKNSKNLSSMLENLLQWALIRRKGIEPDKKSIEVDGIFRETIDLLNDQIRFKNNNVHINANNQNVLCDPESLKLILRNTITNANKFTENGTIKLECEEKNGSVLITISDSGTGMSQDTIQNLFKFGKEQTKPGTAGEKGTGLGLLLIREHLEKNNGSIEVKSDLGTGTVFTIVLPKP
ncbi:MAG: tetratricopeptide repeat protein [Deltaproteobacteria bacterium]